MALQQEVINPKYLPSRLPLFATLLSFLMLDYYNAPDWVWGVVGTLWFIIWPTVIYTRIKQDFVRPEGIKDNDGK